MAEHANPWKEELVRVADRLEGKTKQRRWSERTGFLIERDFIAGAYAVRKLIESHNVSGGIDKRQFPLRTYELIGAAPDPRFPDDIADCYDFDNGRRSKLPVMTMCREVLDSCVFAFCCGETADLFDGVYVAADRRGNPVHLVLASDFIALCRDVGT